MKYARLIQPSEVYIKWVDKLAQLSTEEFLKEWETGKEELTDNEQHAIGMRLVEGVME